MADRELLVRIVGDERDLNRALGNVDRRLTSLDSRTQKFGRNIGRAFAATGITLGTAALFKGLGDAVSAASSLNEEIAKSQQVFGEASGAIQTWSSNTADALGVAQVEALKASGTFGNLFSAVGLGQDAAAGMSQELVQLAADLASFNNADISDVLLAIRSGLVGEAEPLRRYGVLLSEARVQQEAMAATGKGNVKELTNQEKALARYNIIMSDTVLAQGDFARTSEGAANQSRILRAKLADLNTELGAKLLPTVVSVVSATNDLIDVFTQAGDTLDRRLGENLADVDLSGIINMRDRLAEVKGEGDAVVGILDEIIRKLGQVQGVKVTGPGGPGDLRAFLDAAEERDRAAAAAQAKGASTQSAKRFNAFVKGMGLKLDKARLTKSLDDDIAVLRELEQAILRRIKVEGKTFALEQLLTDTRLQIASIIEQNTAATEKVTTATKKNTTARKKLTAAEKQAAEADRRQGQQFEALGLTSEGDKRTPGVEALRRRLGNIRQAVEGTVLDTKKTDRQLDAIAKVLSGKFGKVGKDVRQAILQMFNDIAGAIDEGDKKVGKGPLTKTSGLNTKKFLEGIGLSAEEVNELRGRLSGFTSAGNQSSGGGGGRRRIREGGFGNNPIFVESTTTINLDGQTVAKVVTKQQQKARRRNPQQKRGPNRVGGV